jgi:hypothetical protein
LATTKFITIRSEAGIKNNAKYIKNPDKTTLNNDDETLDKIQASLLNEEEDISETDSGDEEEEKSDMEKAVDYMMNPEKTESEEIKLVSGHNCNPLTAAEEMQNLVAYWKEKRRMQDNDKDAYHLIQSFDPKDNDHLTPEMAHEIGLKLCDEIEHIDDRKDDPDRRYKILVCTHVDKRHIHNHILICPYDIDTGMKYHENKITYRKVQRANDKLCKEYGLSIILNPDEDRKRSYAEEKAKENNSSWKEDIRRDIDAMKSVCKDWDTFVLYMEAAGYELKQGKHITYMKDGKKVRDKTLGREWTKESLLDYWNPDKTKEVPVVEDPFYSEPDKINSKTKEPYKVSRFDENGRKRGLVELILTLAKKIISTEGDTYSTKTYPVNNPIYTRKDYKLQNMMDSISVARKENISSINQIQDKLNETGKKLSHYKLELKKNNATLNKMDTIKKAIEGYQAVRKVVEDIDKLEDGPTKEAVKEEHKEEIAEYKKNKSILYKYRCASDEQIADFNNRYEKVENNISDLENQIAVEKSEYGKYKRLQNNVELAQNKQYLYGPEYEEEKEKISKEKSR